VQRDPAVIEAYLGAQSDESASGNTTGKDQS
jgi:branched-chain amino acid transport system ATP-binding protein